MSENEDKQEQGNQQATAATPAAVNKKTIQKARQALEQELQKALDAKYKEAMSAAENVDKAEAIANKIGEEWDELKTETVNKLRSFDERSSRFAPMKEEKKK